MTHRTLAVAALAILAAGCHRNKEPASQSLASEETAKPSTTATRTRSPSASETASEPAHALDIAALNERKDPDRVLRFYAAALRARDWVAAAKAWGTGSGVTATTLKASYDRTDPPTLELGKGDVEGAAGSLYYEAPVTLRFGAGMPERGSLVLRRVNDVDGATPEQLRWHIERSTIGEGQ